jgi:hypothetical protein
VTPEHRKFRGSDARQLLDNELFKEAFAAIDSYLNNAAIACNPDDAEKARRIVISMQLLKAVKREITRVVEDGKIADIQINELEKRKRFPFFQR